MSIESSLAAQQDRFLSIIAAFGDGDELTGLDQFGALELAHRNGIYKTVYQVMGKPQMHQYGKLAFHNQLKDQIPLSKKIEAVQLYADAYFQNAGNKEKGKRLKKEFQEFQSQAAAFTTNGYREVSQTARTPKNKSLHRVPGAFPYDATLVPIPGGYINASFAFGGRYIQTQCPMKKTVDAFWKMVKHHDVGTIVMLNESSEEAVVPYWPTKVKTEKVFGKIRIRLLETKTSKVQNKPGAAEIIYRKLLLSSPDKEHRVVNHFHYANWKDGKAPDEKGILDLIRCANQCWHGCARQTAVHCYAGVGRTGMYTLLDKCIKDIESGKSFDVREEVRYLRSPQTGRYPYMLTEPQYIVSHRILEKVQRTFQEQETLRETLVKVAELFEQNLDSEALQLAESLPVPYLHNIYEKLWRVMQKPKIPNYGKLAFHSLATDEQGAPSEKKSLAIHMALSGILESNAGNVHEPASRRCSLI